LTLKFLDLKPDDHVIEVGFGGGYLISQIAAVVAQGHVAGVDFSPEMVQLCAKRFAPLIKDGRIELHCAAAEKLPFGSEQFTKACTVNTIYFWADPISPLKELRRVLRDGGRLVVCFNPPETLQKVPYTKYGFSYYEPAEVERFLIQAGFRDIQAASASSRLGVFICAIGTK
jgi:ubiquinone/menaquinone biosynthesis C-methylase UbiE